jgi:A/G-specific adenine glycosylase
MRAKDTKRRKIVASILRWYTHQGRDLPWRHTSDPYRVLLSEIMLQQTQVRRVLQTYPRFLERFPTLASLARSRRSAVVRAWSGMGYNNRAVRLHDLARTVARNGGGLPSGAAALGELPGVGEYTRNAVLAFAFGRRVVVVDVNGRRVLSRLARPMAGTADLLPRAEAALVAAEFLPRRRHVDWNQALMDLGATVCTARRPSCASCPASAWCASAGRMNEETRHRRPEPSLFGVPNRIHRGRVVERLRRTRRSRPLAAGELARQAVPGFSRTHHPWFERLLAGLERDGLVRVHGRGALERRRVSLA